MVGWVTLPKQSEFELYPSFPKTIDLLQLVDPIMEKLGDLGELMLSFGAGAGSFRPLASAHAPLAADARPIRLPINLRVSPNKASCILFATSAVRPAFGEGSERDWS